MYPVIIYSGNLVVAKSARGGEDTVQAGTQRQKVRKVSMTEDGGVCRAYKGHSS
jgi:hypothetical protein